ncbi:MAG: hypothetical protein QNJ54_12410 [Prochloraceae cyanobacterium]|nr:hypothetical protein [Prochloraceae cyanobacterium]
MRLVENARKDWSIQGILIDPYLDNRFVITIARTLIQQLDLAK